MTPPHWQAPPGYISKSSAQGPREANRRAGANITPGGPSLLYEEAQETVQGITGSPNTVIKKLKKVIDLIDPGTIVLWGREGPMSHKVAMRSIDLMSQEVIPAIREYQAVG